MYSKEKEVQKLVLYSILFYMDNYWQLQVFIYF